MGLCSLLKVKQRFGGIYRLLLDTTSVQAGFLLGLFLNTEDGREIFLRNGLWLC
jgi:hypothetical protein